MLFNSKPSCFWSHNHHLVTARCSFDNGEYKKENFFSSFQTSQVSARSVAVTGESVNTSPNVEAILEDFRIMGKDLVKSVEARTEKWAF